MTFKSGFRAWQCWQNGLGIIVDLKGPKSGPTFCSGFEAADPLALAWWPRPSSRQNGT